MSEIRYTDQHEWVRFEGDEATIGITRYAAAQLGDVVYVELPEPGRSLGQGAEAAVVESVKAASEVYAPIGGEVTAAKAAIAADPSKVIADPQCDVWFFTVTIEDQTELCSLMSACQFADFLRGL